MSSPAPEPFDIARARADTPACGAVVHFNNAGSSLPPTVVVDAVVDYLRAEAAEGGYELAERSQVQLDRFRTSVGLLIGAPASEVAFATADTAAWSSAFWGLHRTGAIRVGSRVLVDQATYVSHYLGLLQAARHGDLRIVVVPNDETGALDVDALAGLIDDRVSLVSLTHIGTHQGLINPVAEAGKCLAGSGIPYVLDACQSLGHVAVDVDAIGCDVLTATGRKYLRGPRGTGVLWVRPRLLDRMDPPGIDGHSAAWINADTYELLPDARRFEPFETSMATRVGLGVAGDYALSWGIEAIAARIVALAELLRGELAGLPGVEVLDGGTQRCGIVTFRVAGRYAQEVKAMLSAAGINTSITSATAARLDMASRGVDEAVRASVHYYNTEDEVARLVDAVAAYR